MKKVLFTIFLSMLSVNWAFADTHWSGEITTVNVLENGVAYVFFRNLHDPNPAGATWNCPSDYGYLGNSTEPPKPGFLTLALTAYTTKANVRFGVRMNGGNCEITYLSAR